MSMRSWLIMELLHKKKINGRISMQSQILGAEDTFPQCLRYRYFIKVQGYTLEDLEFH